MPKDKACKDCRFFLSKNTQYFCLRYPPTVQLTVQAPQSVISSDLPHRGVPVMAVNSLWPPVAKDMWCGEYQKKSSN
jgi:hypothetical protein